jgi:hypothetical protein
MDVVVRNLALSGASRQASTDEAQVTKQHFLKQKVASPAARNDMTL